MEITTVVNQEESLMGYRLIEPRIIEDVEAARELNETIRESIRNWQPSDRYTNGEKKDDLSPGGKARAKAFAKITESLEKHWQGD